MPMVRALMIHCRSRVLKGIKTRLVLLSRSMALSGYMTWWVVLVPTSFSKPVVGAWFILRGLRSRDIYFGVILSFPPSQDSSDWVFVSPTCCRNRKHLVCYYNRRNLQRTYSNGPYVLFSQSPQVSLTTWQGDMQNQPRWLFWERH